MKERRGKRIRRWRGNREEGLSRWVSPTHNWLTWWGNALDSDSWLAGEWDHGAALSRPVSFFDSVSQSRSLVGGLATPWRCAQAAEKTCNQRVREKESGILYGSELEGKRERDPLAHRRRLLVGRGSGGRHCFRDIPMLFVFSRSRRFPLSLPLVWLVSVFW